MLLQPVLNRLVISFCIILVLELLHYYISVVRCEEELPVRSPTPSPSDSQYLSGSRTLATPLCPNTLDIVIAVDSSESVQTVWNKLIDDAEAFVNNFQVADHLTRIGVIDFRYSFFCYLFLRESWQRCPHFYLRDVSTYEAPFPWGFDSRILERFFHFLLFFSFSRNEVKSFLTSNIWRFSITVPLAQSSPQLFSRETLIFSVNLNIFS